MKVALFSFKKYEAPFLEAANHNHAHEIQCFDTQLNEETAVLAKSYDAVCAFVSDHLSAHCIEQLHTLGVRVITLRSAGFNNVDIQAAKQFGMPVIRVPDYSPYAVAEFAVTLVLSLNRKMQRAYSRIREQNFLLDGLLGFDLHKKTVGVVGTGNIGAVFCKIMRGFGCNVLAYDPMPSADCEALGVEYVELPVLLSKSDIISLHVPLNQATHHMINHDTLAQMKRGVMLINTSRGGLTDTQALIDGLKSKHIGYLGLDVYEEEEHLFFQDLSDKIIQDDVYARLETFPNVLLTAHQAFFTQEALTNIFDCTINNLTAFAENKIVNNVIV